MVLEIWNRYMILVTTEIVTGWRSKKNKICKNRVLESPP